MRAMTRVSSSLSISLAMTSMPTNPVTPVSRTVSLIVASLNLFFVRNWLVYPNVQFANQATAP